MIRYQKTMQALVGNALQIVTNPFQSAGELAKDPIGSVNAVVGAGITSVTDMINSLFSVASSAETTSETNIMGYSLASLLVLWIFYVGFQQQLGLNRFIPFTQRF